MKKLFDIKKIATIKPQEEDRKNSYARRLFENMSNSLPIEPQQTVWSRKQEKSNELGLSISFSSREDSKDFVAAIQELEDRMQFFSQIEIDKNEIKIHCELPASGIVTDRIKEFLNAAKSIEESINDRR